MATVADRFEALVDRAGAHHRWLGATDQAGVPQFRADGRLTTARRVAWELHHGPLPDGARVAPCPDDRTCVRVEHLSITPPRGRAPHPTNARRPRGDGSMRELQPGVWKLTITTEPHHRISRTITGDRDRAAQERTRLSARHGHPPATMDALITVYLGHLDNIGRSVSTLRRYEQLWRGWLAPTLGAARPDDVRGGDIEAALAAMARAGQSPRSIHQAAVVLNTTFGWAREQQLSATNPVTHCELPDGTTLTGTRHR